MLAQSTPAMQRRAMVALPVPGTFSTHPPIHGDEVARAVRETSANCMRSKTEETVGDQPLGEHSI